MIEKLTLLITVVLAISIASERLVEIIKNPIPLLNKERSSATSEGFRKSALQIMAVVSGCITAWLAIDYIPQDIVNVTSSKIWTIFGLGLLASGGSGMWNAALTYIGNLKDMKGAQAEVAKGISADMKAATLSPKQTGEAMAMMPHAAD